MKRVYADSAATVRPFPAAVEAAERAMREYANPSAAYENAGRARRILESSRALIAEAVNAAPEEIYFTSGGSEGNCLALFGAAFLLPPERRRIACGAIEHASVLEPVRRLEKLGFPVTWLAPDREGKYDPDRIGKELPPDTGLAALMSAQNEVGTLEPTEELGELFEKRGILFHADAVQSVGRLPVDAGRSKASFLTASAHKFGGIKGAGFLYIRKGTPFLPPFGGGGQERGVRPGTENLPGVAAMAAALSESVLHMEEERKRLSALAREIDRAVLALPGVEKTGSPDERLPGFLSYYFAGIDGEALVHALDLLGVDAAAGAACRSGKGEVSPVPGALGYTGGGALRVTLGYENGPEDAKLLAERIPRAVFLLRDAADK